MKKESMFIIGMFSISITLILGRISGDIVLLNFFEGFFSGLSLVMNVGFLIKYRLEKNHINSNFNKKKLGESSQNGYN
ncbi:MAG: hypothetical protein R3255_01185 [Candidatus Lokiarchaeia archaeon]|nr:hypothetical protein [Candidatus Lokiarchaeia archaeon]